jgi:GTP-binding protein EngB required for normal cell division
VTLLSARIGRGAADGSGRRLGERLEALEEVLVLARERIDPDVVAEAERLAEKAGERLRFGGEHTVVALAGATGSGKSSLFNELAGQALSLVGMRRPTTGVAHAAIWPVPGDSCDPSDPSDQPDPAGSGSAAALLDWVQVPRRHVLGPAGERPGPQARPDGPDASAAAVQGLILLDLPDVDSVEQAHRIEADRLVQRADLLIWVLDPQKYADNAVHTQYLAPLAGHQDVMVVVLNQVDRLSPPALAGCLADLRRLLASEGLAGVPVLATSARTGSGLEEVRGLLAARVAAKKAAMGRLSADLSDLAATLEQACLGPAAGPGARAAAGVGRAEQQALVQALSAAAGADVITTAVADAHRLRARQATGWPPTRWSARLRRDPARRLRLRDTPSDLVRTSLPGPSGVQRAQVDVALRELSEQASAGLAEPWPTLVRRAAARSRADLPDLLDRAVAGTDLGLGRPPRWWKAAGLVQLLLLGVALAGVLWLIALFGIAWLQLPDPPLPHWGRVPVPTGLLLAGLGLGVLLSAISRLVAKAGAGRAARRAGRRLGVRVEQLAQDVVVEPVERELAAYTELTQTLKRVRG